jgi:hypothetical protein
MNDLIVKEEPTLIRDQKSNAIISINKAEYAEYKRRRKEKMQLSQLNDRMDKIESNLQKIMSLLENIKLIEFGVEHENSN